MDKHQVLWSEKVALSPIVHVIDNNEAETMGNRHADRVAQTDRK